MMKDSDKPRVIGFIEPSELKKRMAHSRRIRRDTNLSFTLGSKIKAQLTGRQ